MIHKLVEANALRDDGQELVVSRETPSGSRVYHAISYDEFYRMYIGGKLGEEPFHEHGVHQWTSASGKTQLGTALFVDYDAPMTKNGDSPVPFDHATELEYAKHISDLVHTAYKMGTGKSPFSVSVASSSCGNKWSFHGVAKGGSDGKAFLPHQCYSLLWAAVESLSLWKFVIFKEGGETRIAIDKAPILNGSHLRIVYAPKSDGRLKYPLLYNGSKLDTQRLSQPQLESFLITDRTASYVKWLPRETKDATLRAVVRLRDEFGIDLDLPTSSRVATYSVPIKTLTVRSGQTKRTADSTEKTPGQIDCSDASVVRILVASAKFYMRMYRRCHGREYTMPDHVHVETDFCCFKTPMLGTRIPFGTIRIRNDSMKYCPMKCESHRKNAPLLFGSSMGIRVWCRSPRHTGNNSSVFSAMSCVERAELFRWQLMAAGTKILVI